ncbi:SGNH/GDSL hydrolase family protein [Cyanobium sp. FGCU-52]|nr:SGNH/GDSL hydrolase family protein [Cyanobium sp. FGCU52]
MRSFVADQVRASLSGGTNYAVGGATTGVENFVEVWNVTPSDLKPDYANKGNAWQLSSFSAASPAFDPETSLFMVWLFPNDPFYLSASSGLGVGTFAGGASTNGIVLPTAVDNIIGTIQELAGFGARNFLVPNSPDLGLIPEFLGSPSEASFTQLSSTFNTNLATALHGLAVSRPDLSIEAFQTDDLFAEVRADPGAFGFSDVSNRCQTTAGCGNGSAEDQSSFLFWDGSHPTTAGHALIGQRFYQAVYEQVPGPLPAAGVVVVLGWSRRLRSRIRLSGASRLQASEPKNQP